MLLLYGGGPIHLLEKFAVKRYFKKCLKRACRLTGSVLFYIVVVIRSK